MMFGLGVGTEGEIAAPACSFSDDELGGFVGGLKSWMPLDGVSWSLLAKTNFEGLFQLSTWACYPMNQLGVIVAPLAVALIGIAVLKKGRR